MGRLLLFRCQQWILDLIVLFLHLYFVCPCIRTFFFQSYCTPPSDKKVLLAKKKKKKKKTVWIEKPSTHLHIYSIANSHSPHQSCWQKDPPVFQVTATELTVFTLWHLFKVTAWARYLISLTLLKLASTPECSYAVNFVENKHKFTKAAKKAHHGQRNAVQQRETACLRIGGEVTSQTTL